MCGIMGLTGWVKIIMWFVIPKFSCEGELRKSVYLIIAKTNISDLALWVFSGIGTGSNIWKG